MLVLPECLKKMLHSQTSCSQHVDINTLCRPAAAIVLLLLLLVVVAARKPAAGFLEPDLPLILSLTFSGRAAACRCVAEGCRRL